MTREPTTEGVPMRHRHRSIPAVVGLLALLTACGSSSTLSEATPEPTVETTTVTTEAPTTTVAPTTVAPTTTVATAAGWTAFDPYDIGLPLAVPCCASNWYDLAASPAFPAPGEPLADGVYRIEWEWPATAATTVTARLHRFAPCSELPDGSCEAPPEGMAFAPTEVGVDPTDDHVLELPLDATLTVVLGGFNGWEADGSYAVGNGLDLVDLVMAVDADFDVAIMQPHLAGANDGDIVAGLVATPAHGFGPAPDDVLVLAYTHGEAPPLLFQTLFYNWDDPDTSRGSDVLGPIALQVDDGTYTVTVYAGFYS
jgi:hypothetical protein